MRILVLGAYGLIGLEVSKHLARAGHDVVGLARSSRRGRALLPEIEWIAADLATLVGPERWRPHLRGVDAVVNASGALQSGPEGSLAAIQRDAIIALVDACRSAGPKRLIQISAPGAAPGATTEFLRTKGEADAAIKASGLDWTVFRPGLVLASTAYGGTSLLRMLAAFPVVQPIVHAQARIQTVSVEDVASAVRTALEGDIGHGSYDLVEDEPHSLEEVVAAIRVWLGFAPARATLRLPRITGRALACLADLAGWLGWRSPLRSTALSVLERDVLGDPEPWRAVAGGSLEPLAATLRGLPSTLQERSYARTRLAFPILLLTLAAFWIVSGVVGIWRSEAAVALLVGHLPLAAAEIAVWTGAVVDIGVGLALLARPIVRPACVAAILISALYLIAASVLLPGLWADPLGPLVKTVPAMALALAVWAQAEER